LGFGLSKKKCLESAEKARRERRRRKREAGEGRREEQGYEKPTNEPPRPEMLGERRTDGWVKRVQRGGGKKKAPLESGVICHSNKGNLERKQWGGGKKMGLRIGKPKKTAKGPDWKKG